MKLQRERMAVWDAALGRITEREVEYVPALCKLFDELLVNAADNQHNDPTMTTIRVSLNADTGAITVFNDGRRVGPGCTCTDIPSQAWGCPLHGTRTPRCMSPSSSLGSC